MKLWASPVIGALVIVPSLGVSGSIAWQTEAKGMNTVVLEQPFYVVGYSVRTRNDKEMSDDGKIGPLWQRFMQGNFAAQIPNRTDDTLIVVYSDYASDENGDYDYLLGARVTSIDKLPAGTTYTIVQPGSYAVVMTEVGAMPGVLRGAWRRIWQMTPAELGGRRAFQTDFEIYDQRSADPKRGQVEIHIGLKRGNN